MIWRRKKYVVGLTLDERNELLAKISKGYLKAQANRKARMRATFVMDGLEVVFRGAPRIHQSIKPIFDGEAETKLIALTCSEPSEGYAHWTIRLLAEKVARSISFGSPEERWPRQGLLSSTKI